MSVLSVDPISGGAIAIKQLGSRLVFTVEQRDALRERVLRLAKEDERVVAGAAVGSLAVDAVSYTQMTLPTKA
jgi:hypothetical protein